jgi:excisionase family DNA binding protein
MSRQEIVFTITEAARLVGVSPSTLRNWEKRGLLAAERTASGHRRFTLADVAVLRRLHDGHVATDPAGDVRQLQTQAPGTAHVGSPSPDHGGTPAWAHHLRRLRTQGRCSLRQVSARTGLSASFISMVERGLANPSVAALQKLTAAYGTSIVELMGGSSPTPLALVRRDDRKVYDVTPGVSMEQLNFGPHQMELHLFTVEPGAGTGETYHHPGEEFIFLLAGQLVVWLDHIERYAMAAGDVLYFESGRPHEWVNPGTEPAVFLGVNTPATF